ncbi:hypothetical protein PACTADRAFT_16552, partial [Pachysolen tannophilus NRRL Y-2460]
MNQSTFQTSADARLRQLSAILSASQGVSKMSTVSARVDGMVDGTVDGNNKNFNSDNGVVGGNLNGKFQIAVIGSGNWGTTVAKVVSENVANRPD